MRINRFEVRPTPATLTGSHAMLNWSCLRRTTDHIVKETLASPLQPSEYLGNPKLPKIASSGDAQGRSRFPLKGGYPGLHDEYVKAGEIVRKKFARPRNPTVRAPPQFNDFVIPQRRTSSYLRETPRQLPTTRFFSTSRVPSPHHVQRGKQYRIHFTHARGSLIFFSRSPRRLISS